jgi:DNA polymerase-1
VRALLDADNIAVACAFAAENKTEEDAKNFSTMMINNILDDVKATEHELWLSGGDNFRYGVYPEYKANRKGVYRPKYEAVVKQHMVDSWQANYAHGIEADDMLSIRHAELGEASVLCHLDKDLNQSKGKHYNWPLVRLGEFVRETQYYDVSTEEADYWFFHQLLTGDNTDNIKGIVGIGAKKAAGILYGCETNQQRYEEVLARYSCEEELDMNAQCIYIWRKPNDNWRNILSDTSIS